MYQRDRGTYMGTAAPGTLFLALHNTQREKKNASPQPAAPLPNPH